jgi:hypothetical protein
LECIGPDGEECDDIPPLIDICLARPTEMEFKYNGGDCSQSFNIQPISLFQCFDFQGGPPTQAGEESYIVVSDIKGLGIDYFSGFVPVGETFDLNTGGQPVQANMNVSIYSQGPPPGQRFPGFDSMLQTLVFHSSCSRNLFLKDRFGAIQLVGFENAVQGLVTCFINTTFTFMISGTGQFDTILRELYAITNLEQFLNLTDEVNGQELVPGQPFTIETNYTLDLSVRRRYTVLATIVGETVDSVTGEPNGEFCRDTDFLEFVAGNPLPPIFPTVAPTAEPAGTP